MTDRTPGAGDERPPKPRPAPTPDADSAPYWAAAAQHVLTASRCAVCAAYTMPPDVVCPHCGARQAW